MKKIPKSVKKIFKPVYNAAKIAVYKTCDYYDGLKGRKNPIVPPRHMIFIGDGDYIKIGEEFLTYFKELGQLKPAHKVLDVGCGIGRMSVPLTKYLSEEGEYFGFDIVKKGIEWCKKNISVRYPNFHYDHANIYNKMYNPEGTEKSSEYRFSFENKTFDFVFLTSVFTHMMTADITRYVSEISRVMKKGGKCLITFFLLNRSSRELIKNGASSQNLIHRFEEYSFIKDNDLPESAIGFDEEFIRRLFSVSSLRVIEPIHYGSWCGRKTYRSYQDIVIAEKL
jgi:ubiquinone/menaquinone biosynthesis C-methylase UbiE